MRPIESGNPRAPVWVLGEAPGQNEMTEGRPFVGASGWELDKMLRETGFDRSQMFLTNVCHERPTNNDIEEYFLPRRQAGHAVLGKNVATPLAEGIQYLHERVATLRPTLILAFGNTALWALTGLEGIKNHRGSQITTTAILLAPDVKLIPTYHPAAVLREWSLRHIVIHDLRKARREAFTEAVEKPEWRFTPAPAFDEAWSRLQSLIWKADTGPMPLVCDIETRKGQIFCVGLAPTRLNALCIPFMRGNGSYWSEREEHTITLKLRQLLTHENVQVIFQNGAYDAQYFAKQWGYIPRIADDTMLMQHVCFPGLPKGLVFLSSMYCQYHRYWKDDGKEAGGHRSDEDEWSYNCEDVVRTFECWEALTRLVDHLGLRQQYNFQIKELFPSVVRMMLRGIRVDNERRRAVRRQLEDFLLSGHAALLQMLGHPLNVESAPRMKSLFYEDLHIPPIINRKTKRPTLDDDALDTLARKYPLLRPLIGLIRDIRSANTAISNVLDTQFSPDGRARCTYNLAGTPTFRFSSSEDSFGDGTNLQNITLGEDA